MGTREQGATLSEEQVSLRSNVTASGNAQRIDDTAAWDADAARTPAAVPRSGGGGRAPQPSPAETGGTVLRLTSEKVRRAAPRHAMRAHAAC